MAKNPRRSLTSQFSMARTKQRIQELSTKNKSGIQRYNELATVAHCMDNYLREENERLETRLNILRQHIKFISNKHKNLQQSYNELQRGWEHLANTINDIAHENEALRRTNRRLTEQLLDQEESDPEWEANVDYHELRDQIYRDV